MDVRVWYVIGRSWVIPAALWSLSFVEDAGGGDEHGAQTLLAFAILQLGLDDEELL